MIYLAAKFYGACLIHEVHYQSESYRQFLHIHHLIILYSGTLVHEFNSFLEAVRRPKCS
jgi:hypothetical protein